MKTKEELKLYFENGDKPTQEHFWQWQDSYWHKEEKLTNNDLNLIADEEFTFSPTDDREIIGIGRRITFPENVKTIGGFIFNNFSKNHIIEIKLPNSLEKIKASAFNNQYLKGVLRIPGSCKTIESSAFGGINARITQLVLENGIEIIGNGAFVLQMSDSLKDLYIPNSVQWVGELAFYIPSLLTVSAPTGLDLTNSGIPETATITYR